MKTTNLITKITYKTYLLLINNLIAVTIFILTCVIFFSQPLHAEGPPLEIAADNFAPPFVMRGANDQFFGFDIAMMEYICQTIHRTCTYHPMPFWQILNTVATHKADVAIGSITITLERAAYVNFSIPYLPSQSSFLGRQSLANQPFSLNQLNNKTIGVTKGTVFQQEITSLGIVKPTVIEYDRFETMLEALKSDDIDAALMDLPTALYWQSQTSDAFSILGKPILYGFGFGIAVNPNNLPLLAQINKALEQYQKSKQFKSDYQKYLGQF